MQNEVGRLVGGGAGERTPVLIDAADQFVDILARDFSLDVPEAAALWPAICARHEELFGAKPD